MADLSGYRSLKLAADGFRNFAVDFYARREFLNRSARGVFCTDQGSHNTTIGRAVDRSLEGSQRQNRDWRGSLPKVRKKQQG